MAQANHDTPCAAVARCEQSIGNQERLLEEVRHTVYGNHNKGLKENMDYAINWIKRQEEKMMENKLPLGVKLACFISAVSCLISLYAVIFK